jgi:pectinesterase
MKRALFFISVCFILSIPSLYAADSHYIIVAQDGSGDYKTINGAIAALPMFNYERTVIFIKNGVYNEKFRIDQDFITLRGESREKTIIRYSQLRTDWIANKDSIGPAVINLNGDDVVIENMTIENSQPEVGPHAFAIYGTGTRTVIVNCNVLSKGGDTVSLWNYKSGMYYHANCFFEGAVDFVCPRGWCYIKDSRFFEVKPTATVWHAGGFNAKQKFVLKNCSFDGVKDFELGRHHYDAQFYLLDCSFSDSMKDKPIYRVISADPKANRPFNWGERYYFSHPRKAGKQFPWLQDNFNSLPEKVQPTEITPLWTFDGKWDPETISGPAVVQYKIEDNRLFLTYSELMTVSGIPELITGTHKKLVYLSGAGSTTLEFTGAAKLSKQDIVGIKLNNNAEISGTTASVNARPAGFVISDQN